eukprot:2496430-Prymnesium_polylepis.1
MCIRDSAVRAVLRNALGPVGLDERLWHEKVERVERVGARRLEHVVVELPELVVRPWPHDAQRARVLCMDRLAAAAHEVTHRRLVDHLGSRLGHNLIARDAVGPSVPSRDGAPHLVHPPTQLAVVPHVIRGLGRVPAGRVLGTRRKDHPEARLGRLGDEGVHKRHALLVQVASRRVVGAALEPVAVLDRIVPEQAHESNRVGCRDRTAQVRHVERSAAGAHRSVRTSVPLKIHIDALEHDGAAFVIDQLRPARRDAKGPALSSRTPRRRRWRRRRRR